MSPGHTRRHWRGMPLAILLTLLGGWAMTATVHTQDLNSAVIAGGPHDLSTGSALQNSDTAIDGQTCIFCHTPHGGDNTIPLWNRSAPTGAYQLYSSSTTDVTTTASLIRDGVSGACLSCHDGSIAMDVLTNVNGLAFTSGVSFTTQAGAKSTFGNTGGGTNNLMTGGLPFLGVDLRNDHPVAIVYATAKTATPDEFVTVGGTATKITVGDTDPLPLFGASAETATVECASCHNPHNNTLGNFLRKANTGSAICTSCHIK